MPGFLLIVLVPYLLVNYYAGRRLWQYLFSHRWPAGRRGYWAAFWLVALTPLAARIKGLLLNTRLKDFLAFTGDYWLAALYYLVMAWLLVDSGRLIARALGRRTGAARPPAVGLVVATAVALLLVYGSWNARDPQVTTYEVTIAKPAGGLDGLRVVMVADIHLGPIVGGARLEELVALINSRQPDLVLLAGDIIDENVSYFVERKMGEPFGRLQPRYGVWAALGNHEYISGKAEEVVAVLEVAGIRVLRDDYARVGDSLYVVGRDDRRRASFDARGRAELAAVMTGVDRRLPIILIDHQPYQLEEAAGQGVDLQVSGHTHVGQMFPNNFVTGRIFENDWGLLCKGAYHAVVSSGYGTWGPPIRVGNKPEIVEINIRLAP